ncbi:hypothetical protein Vretimale_5902, partial [Volvox reticuliferus]
AVAASTIAEVEAVRHVSFLRDGATADADADATAAAAATTSPAALTAALTDSLLRLELTTAGNSLSACIMTLPGLEAVRFAERNRSVLLRLGLLAPPPAPSPDRTAGRLQDLGRGSGPVGGGGPSGAHRRHYFFGPAAAAMSAATAVAGLLSSGRRQSRRASVNSVPARAMSMPLELGPEAAQDVSNRSHCSQAHHLMALTCDASGGSAGGNGARPRSRDWHNRGGIGHGLLHLVGLNASRRHSTLGPPAAAVVVAAAETVVAASPLPDAAASRGRFALQRRSESSNHVRLFSVMADEPCGRAKSAVWSNRRSTTGGSIRMDGSAAALQGSLTVTVATSAATAAAEPSIPPRQAILSSFLHHFSGMRRRSTQSLMPNCVSARVPSLLVAKMGAAATAVDGSGVPEVLTLAGDSEAPAAQPDLGCHGRGQDDFTKRLVDGSSTGQRWPLQDNDGGVGVSDGTLRPSRDNFITSQRLGLAKLPSPPPPRQQQQQPKEQASAAATVPLAVVAGVSALWTSGEGDHGHRDLWPVRSLVSLTSAPQRLTHPAEVAIPAATATAALVSSCDGMARTGGLRPGHKGSLGNLLRSSDGGFTGGAGRSTLSFGTRSLRCNPVPDTSSSEVNRAANCGGGAGCGARECNGGVGNCGAAYHHHHQHHHHLHHHKHSHNDHNDNHHNRHGPIDAPNLGRIWQSCGGAAAESASACGSSPVAVRPIDTPVPASHRYPAMQGQQQPYRNSGRSAVLGTLAALRCDADGCDGDGEVRIAADTAHVQTRIAQVASVAAAESSPAVPRAENVGRGRPAQVGPHRRTRGGGGGGGGGSSASASGSGSGVEEVVRTMPRGPSLLNATSTTPQPIPPCRELVTMSCRRAAQNVADSSCAVPGPSGDSPQGTHGEDHLADALRLWHGTTAAAASAAAVVPPESTVVALVDGPAGSAAAATNAAATEGDALQGHGGGAGGAGEALVFARVAPPLSGCPQAPEVLRELQASVVRLTLVESVDPRVAASLGCGLYICSLEATSLLGLSGVSIESSSRPRASELRSKEGSTNEPSVHRRVVEAAGKVLLPLQLPLRRWLPSRMDSAAFGAAEDT